MNNFLKHIQKNKISWNRRTRIHIDSDFYNNKLFKKNQSSLKSIETEEIGNINNKELLHLQCHFGQDSISLARKGANVTAVDFSKNAIQYAKKMAQELEIPINFIEEDVLQLNLRKEFDIVFTSYGVIGWLPDLDKWANIIVQHLKKGGFFLLTEFHPFISLLDNNQYDYFYKESPDQEKQYGSYTDGGENTLIEDCWWNHSLTEIFSSLESNGLKLKSFKEFDYSPYLLKGMVEREEGQYVLGERKDQRLPYVFTLQATKK